MRAGVPGLPLLLAALAAGCAPASAPRAPGAPLVHVVPVGEGWARSSINAVIFRRASVTSRGGVQYTAWYDSQGRMMLAKRRLGSDRWEVEPTRYTGNVRDAHNTISLGVDGRGVLHIAWDAHGGPLRYARGVAPGSLELTPPLPMTGLAEERVTYPQFYPLPDGDLLFLYRDGQSGGGDVMLDRYDPRSRSWRVVSHPLIAGEGERNAYVNPLVVDSRGGWHLSWVWRETPDVATNHDVLYAFSPDEGRSWRSSGGAVYALPIIARTAEVAWRVPQGSDLINQTTMAVDGRGHPLIATYWRAQGSGVPQFRLVWHDGGRWRTTEVGHRTLPFRLSGGGTKRIPVSRPLVLAGRGDAVYVVFRDEERGDGVSVAASADPGHGDWRVSEIFGSPVGHWEPTYDAELWSRERRLHLLLERVGQGDGETLEALAPQPVSILEWTPP
jgi:hypothetical protein